MNASGLVDVSVVVGVVTVSDIFVVVMSTCVLGGEHACALSVSDVDTTTLAVVHVVIEITAVAGR